MRHVFQTYLKYYTINHLQEENLKKTVISILYLSLYKKYKREDLLSLFCIGNHLLGLFYEEKITI